MKYVDLKEHFWGRFQPPVLQFLVDVCLNQKLNKVMELFISAGAKCLGIFGYLSTLFLQVTRSRGQDSSTLNQQGFLPNQSLSPNGIFFPHKDQVGTPSPWFLNSSAETRESFTVLGICELNFGCFSFGIVSQIFPLEISRRPRV